MAYKPGDATEADDMAKNLCICMFFSLTLLVSAVFKDVSAFEINFSDGNNDLTLRRCSGKYAAVIKTYTF